MATNPPSELPPLSPVEGARPLVGVSALTSLTALPQAVSALVGLGASPRIRLANLPQHEMKSIVSTLNSGTHLVSAAISLRGSRPTE